MLCILVLCLIIFISLFQVKGEKWEKLHGVCNCSLPIKVEKSWPKNRRLRSHGWVCIKSNKKLKINNYYIPVGATTRIGHMMTSPKFSKWRSNQGTRSRATFQLFATSRNDLFPQHLSSCTFVWRGNTWVWKKKWHPMKSACSLEVKQLKTGVFQLKDLPDRAQNIWR